MVARMQEPDPNDVRSEAEMGAEEFLGRPVAGNPDERITALQKRIEYLEGCKRLLTANVERGKVSPSDAQASAQSFDRDLAEARRQLAEWQHQHKGRN